MISGDPILYRDSIIHLKTESVELQVKRQKIVVSFDVLLLGKDEAVLGMPFLQEFNPKIDWITKEVEVKDTRKWKQ